MDSAAIGSSENFHQNTAHSAPKPAAPLDVDVLLHRLETQTTNVQAADLQMKGQQTADSNSAEKQSEETRVRDDHIQNSQIDERIAQLESIHAQLTRDLNRARA